MSQDTTSYNSPTSRREKNEKDELSTQFERSVTFVRNYTSRLEHDIGRPALRLGGELFDERPITATFLAIFSMLGALPVVSFLGVASFTIISFLSIAVIIALSSAAAVILGLFAVLVAILIASACVASFLSVGAISSYLFFRLAFILRQKGVSRGLSEWSDEVWRHVLYTFSKRQHSDAGIQDDARSESTNESAVMVQAFEPFAENRHDETYSSDSDVKVQG